MFDLLHRTRQRLHMTWINALHVEIDARIIAWTENGTARGADCPSPGQENFRHDPKGSG